VKSESKRGAVTGVSDHGGWAVLVTVAPDGALVDRRRVELVDENLPSLPHHHDGQLLPIAEAVALVERVRASAETHAARALDELADAVAGIRAIALRRCPPLPPSISARITDARARNVADWVMYRMVLAAAAEARGWSVAWYDAKTVLDSASRALRVERFEAHFLQMRATVGHPWNQDHKLAMAAAVSAAAAFSA
jgi:hypothetical protein